MLFCVIESGMKLADCRRARISTGQYQLPIKNFIHMIVANELLGPFLGLFSFLGLFWALFWALFGPFFNAMGCPP